MESATKMRRLKNITASRDLTRSGGPKAGRLAITDVTLHGKTSQSTSEDESAYDKYAAESHDCEPTCFKLIDDIDVYDNHCSGNDYREPLPSIGDTRGTATKVTMTTLYDGKKLMQTATHISVTTICS
ncbi:hypothetical protein DPMN_093717 [Dreissena polymorpha]|uniref:Uncharacterized protein n=1 Tax=Dreissena polymorpha TaxID=45954 RepID=A0A9D4L4Q0_DREPO|nr:hypothetical protein DPMN_093717 [Dreissena polymorpha]